MKCLYRFCDKEVVRGENKRMRKYCDDDCRIKEWAIRADEKRAEEGAMVGVGTGHGFIMK
jgi:hypothetical protein